MRGRPRLTELIINVRTDPAGTVVTLTGEVNYTNAGQLRRAITTALASTPKALAVDLARITDLESSGISALVAGRREADARHVDYRVINPQGMVTTTLKITGLVEYLNVAVEPDVVPTDTDE